MTEEAKKLDLIAKEIKAMRVSLHNDIPAMTKAIKEAAEALAGLSAAYAAMAEDLKERLKDVPETKES